MLIGDGENLTAESEIDARSGIAQRAVDGGEEGRESVGHDLRIGGVRWSAGSGEVWGR
jgi:hypothetical protein